MEIHPFWEMHTPVTEMLNIDLPIIGAPMFLISNPLLVSAVSNCGGLGTFPAQNYRDLSSLKEALLEIRSLTSKPFGVNLLMNKEHNPEWPRQLEILMEEKIPVVIASLGIPRSIVKDIQKTGAKLFYDAISLRQAKLAVKLGVDAVIAVCQGAGGHAGKISPFSLIQQFSDEFQTFEDGRYIPVIAAGAISGGRQMAAAMALGADAVYIGTKLIASKESAAPQEYKQMILESDAGDILYSDKISGIYANWLVPSLKKAKIDLTRDYLIMDEFKRWKDIWSAGHGVSQINKILSVDEIMQNFMTEYKDTLRRLAES